MNKYIKVTPYSKRNCFSDLRWRVFFYKDAVMSGCHLDLKLDNVTGMYSTYLKIKATRDFVKDNNQVHQLGFQPLPGFPHAMWENYTMTPITVRRYYYMHINMINIKMQNELFDRERERQSERESYEIFHWFVSVFSIPFLFL